MSPAHRVVGIIQARMGATRLPNKMLLALQGHPVIEWVWRRACMARRLDHVVVAIPDLPGDDVLALILCRLGANVFRGSEKDVVARFHDAAREARATHVVRICADNPLICASEIDYLVEHFFANPCDYAYNHIPRNNLYPDGLGAEMISFSLLERIAKEATSPAHREHLLNFVWENQKDFVIRTFDPPDAAIRVPTLKLDIDRLEDYRFFIEHDLTIDMDARSIIAKFTDRRK